MRRLCLDQKKIFAASRNERELLEKFSDHCWKFGLLGNAKTRVVVWLVSLTELINPAVYCGWLKMLLKSPRSSKYLFSVKLNFFPKDMSQLLIPGMRMVLRPALVRAPAPAAMYIE